MSKKDANAYIGYINMYYIYAHKLIRTQTHVLIYHYLLASLKASRPGHNKIKVTLNLFSLFAFYNSMHLVLSCAHFNKVEFNKVKGKFIHQNHILAVI